MFISIVTVCLGKPISILKDKSDNNNNNKNDNNTYLLGIRRKTKILKILKKTGIN